MKIKNEKHYIEVCEACAEYANEKLKEQGVPLNKMTDVVNYLRGNIAFLRVENFICLFLDIKNRILASEVISTGTINTAAVYPREILRKIILHDAHSVIFAHNHPSGSCEPSTHDKEFTRIMERGLRDFGVNLLDHIIISKYEYFSFHEYGYFHI